MAGFQPRPDADYNASNVQEQAASGLAVAETRKATRRKSKYQVADTSSVAAADDIRNQPLNTSSRTSRNAVRGSRDDRPHISTRPSLVDTTRIETSIWDWDTQADTVGSSGYYEPQGELLQERREQTLEAAEVTLPYPVSNQRPSLRSYSSQGSARPVRPVAAGNKRRVSWETESPRRTIQLEQQLSLPELSAMDTDETQPSLTNTPIQSGSDRRPRDDANLSSGQPNPLDFQEERAQPSGGVSISRTFADSSIAPTLPARKVFPIQIGDRLFRLSGASISSDGEYQTHFESHPLQHTLILQSAFLLFTLLRRSTSPKSRRRQCSNTICRSRPGYIRGHLFALTRISYRTARWSAFRPTVRGCAILQSSVNDVQILENVLTHNSTPADGATLRFDHLHPHRR